MAHITLHPELGVNPRLCFCPRCGGPSNMLVLAGNRNYYTTCNNCGMRGYGIPVGDRCKKDGCHGHFDRRKELEASEQLPGDLCDGCEKEIVEHKAVVAAGGIYWKCDACNQQGVIKATAPICQTVREQSGIKPPAPVGIAFDKCEEHTPKEEPDGKT